MIHHNRHFNEASKYSKRGHENCLGDIEKVQDTLLRLWTAEIFVNASECGCYLVFSLYTPLPQIPAQRLPLCNITSIKGRLELLYEKHEP
jgi:hypothetical protein